MVIRENIGNLGSFNVGNRCIDVVTIEWYEVNKRIIHKRTQSGRELLMKFMDKTAGLTEGDVLWQDETTVLVVEIQPADTISIRPSSMYQVACLCYEIGNKHLPLFYVKDELLVPYEAPLFRLLSAAGYEPKRENRKLINQLKTTVSPHGHSEIKQSLFSKILQFTTPSPDD